MSITATQNTLIIAGAEGPISTLIIDGQKLDFNAYNGNLDSVNYGINITIRLFGFVDVDEAFYGFNPTGGGSGSTVGYRHGVYVIEVPTQQKFN